VVGTKVLTPRNAIILAAVTNLVGGLFGSNVAKTISSGLLAKGIIPDGLFSHMLICALLGGIVWNLVTWWFGLPSSSTHAMVGGLAGGALGMTQGNWSVLLWDSVEKGKSVGYLHKVVYPMMYSPIAGFILALIVMKLLYIVAKKIGERKSDSIFGKLQLVSSAYMGFMHGMSDAQKTMGIITLGLLAATKAGAMDGAPSFLHQGDDNAQTWVKLACAVVMAAGTAMGGWRIIKTLAEKLVDLKPIHGFAAETTAATILGVTQHFGMSVSTTHAITTSIMGAGSADGWDKVSGVWVRRILGAWVLTIPCAAGTAWLCVIMGRALGLIPAM
jgi:inorganic phosphate transporter, PiT family